MVGNRLIGQVIQGEGEAVDAGAVGIVAQLGLDHAVSHAVHGQEGRGADGGADVGQAGTLLDDGVIGTLAAEHRLGGTHQQGVDQSALGHALIGQALLPEVLGDDGGQTGHLGGGHRGAAHDLILIRLPDSAVDGVDVAAGGGDIGLQGQVAGNTEGAEGAHGLVGGAVVIAGEGSADGQLAGAVGNAALGLLLGADGCDGSTGGLGDGDHGHGVVDAVQVGEDHARLVVVDQKGGSTGLGGDVGLLVVVKLAPGADGDLAGQVDAGVIGGIAQARDVDELMLGAGAVGGTVQGGQGVVAVAVAGLGVGQGLGVAEDLAVHHDAAADGAVIVHGGNGHEAGEGAGGADGVQVHVLAVEVAGGGVGGPGAVVACGGDDGHAAGHDALHHLLVGRVIGGTGGGGTQGQVDAVGTQQQGVLDGGHDVGVKGTALLAEDLHDQQLGVGSGTGHIDGLQGIDELAAALDEAVGGGDTGDVGAMLALVVVVMGDVQVGVHIVEAEGSLGVDVQLLGGQGLALFGHGLVGVQLLQNGDDVPGVHQLDGLAGLLQGIGQSLGAEGLVIGVQTGVDDGHAAACAGVALQPGFACAGHLAGDGHVGGVFTAHGDHVGGIAVLDRHGTDAVQLRDPGDVAATDIGGNQVGSQGQIPDHVQLLTAQDPALDGLLEAILLGTQLFAVEHGIGIGGDAVHLKAGTDGGGFLQMDGDADHLVRVSGGSQFFQTAHVVHGRCVDGAVVELLQLEAQLMFAANRFRRGHEACQHGHDQQQRKDLAEQIAVFHFLSSLFFGPKKAAALFRPFGCTKS